MAGYSYKDLCYQIPEYINKAFVDEFKREPDGDPGYDGDCWTLAAMYVEDLIKQRDELLDALERTINASAVSMSHSEYVTVLDEANAVLTKAKGGAVNHFPDAAKMVPDGWQLVPVEPTEAMISEVIDAGTFDEDDVAYFWGSMLAAAPKLEGGAA